MDKSQQEASSVNGFVFGSAEDVELAKNELNAAKYIEKKIADKNANTVLTIYRAALDKKMFRTPVGYSYMHDLQKRMIEAGIDASEIAPIPLYQIYGSPAQEDKPARVIKVKKKKEPLERRNAMLTVVNIILLTLVIVMFLISVSGSRPTVLNYRRALENEYSSWKQELDERESAIRAKERELNISVTIDESGLD